MVMDLTRTEMRACGFLGEAQREKWRELLYISLDLHLDDYLQASYSSETRKLLCSFLAETSARGISFAHTTDLFMKPRHSEQARAVSFEIGLSPLSQTLIIYMTNIVEHYSTKVKRFRTCVLSDLTHTGFRPRNLL